MKAVITKEWCERMAKLEGDAEIGAGLLSRDLVFNAACEHEWKDHPDHQSSVCRKCGALSS